MKSTKQAKVISINRPAQEFAQNNLSLLNSFAEELRRIASEKAKAK